MSTIATDRLLETASRLRTLIGAHAPDAGRELGEWLHPWLQDGETLPDHSLALQLPARMIRQKGQRLLARRNELDDARQEEAEARLQRDRAASALRRMLVDDRRLLTALYGPRRTATLLGIEGATAPHNVHELLLEHAAAFLKLFRDPERLAVACTDAVSLDSAAAADALEPLVVALREALGRCDKARRASAARRDARDRAWADLELAVRGAVLCLRGSLLLIQRTDLAKKLSPLPRTRKEVSMT